MAREQIGRSTAGPADPRAVGEVDDRGLIPEVDDLG